MKPKRTPAVFATCALAALGWAEGPIQMDVSPTFLGTAVDSSAVTVTLENSGRSTKGTLRVFGNGGETTYPVDLPHGVRRRVTTYPEGQSWQLRYVLDTDLGSIERYQPTAHYSLDRGGSALLIGNNVGGLSFLRPKGKIVTDGTALRDAYVVAKDAPERAVAYRSQSAVFLGAGAERLSDAAIEALKGYALSGGTLVFLGGEAATALRDARWADALPGSGWKISKTINAPALKWSSYRELMAEHAVQEPSKTSEGTTSSEWTYEHQRGFGLGRIAVLEYSPLDTAFKGWDGRAPALSRYVRVGPDALKAHQFVESYRNAGLNGVHTYQYGSPEAARYGNERPNDPFSAKLPPSGTVFGILATYFVLVVPVSFLVLRRLKRAEWAWATAPLLSVGFAGVLFSSAQSLYAAKLSTASQGVVVLQEGERTGMFFGTSQMYFPKGGTYDLGLKGVDSLTPVGEDQYVSNGLDGFDPVDDGREIQVPRLQANNLAFRELSYAQRIDDADWFTIDLVDNTHAKVVNQSPYRFRGSLAHGESLSMPFELKAGESKVVDLTIGSNAFITGRRSSPAVLDLTETRGRIALDGRLDGFRPGPQVGETVESQSGFAVVAFAKESMK